MKVSVIVPVLDAEPYLGQALGSVLEQTHAPHEVIVVDDGSTDGSVETARRFAAAFPQQVRVVDGRTGRASRARNLGASLATGDALMFLDADDVVAPDTLAVLAHALEVDPGGIAACPWYRLVVVDGGWVARPASCRPRRPGQDALDAWLSGWYHPPCSVLWSREAFERAGRWDELCTVNDDGDLMMRALVLGLPLVVQTAGAAYYRRRPPGHGASLSGLRKTRAGLESQLRVLRKVEVWLEEHGRAAVHRQALAQAADRLALDAEPFPDLVAAAARLGAPRRAVLRLPVPPRARVLGAPVRRAAGAARALRRAARPVRREQAPTVVHGLATASRAAGTDATARCEDPTSAPLVSVIVPTYQRAHVLPRTLRSVLAQTMTDLEVLVVDDGSTDGTASVMAGYDRRVRYVPQPQNMGVSAARNRGLREARGCFIAFLDSDDEWAPDKLERQVQRLREVPESVGVVYTGVTDDDGAGRRRGWVPLHRGDVHHALLQVNVLHAGASSVVMRRSVVPAAGFFDEQIPAIEDYDYWLRASRWFEFDYVSDPLVVYHDPRALERKSRRVDENLHARAYFYRKHEKALRDAGLAAAFLLRSARRHLHDDHDVQGARALARRAWLLTPQAAEARRILLRAHLPRSIVRLRRRLRGQAAAPQPVAEQDHAS